MWTTERESLYGFWGSCMGHIFVDHHSQVPVHAQIKEQIRFLCLQQKLRPGDALPSIRRLARQLGVGDGVIRRVYRELRDEDVLLVENREHVLHRSAATAASRIDLVRASERRGAQLIAWAKKHDVSAIAFGRFLLRQASIREAGSPSYVFVDICRPAAERSAFKISKAWNIPVAGMSMGDIKARWRTDARTLTAVLVNEHLYEDAIAVAEGDASRLFSVKVRLDERLRRRISRLQKGSNILVICADDDFASTGPAMLHICKRASGPERRVEVKNVSDISSLTALLSATRHGLFLFSPLVWETLPTQISRMARAVPAFSEPDPQGLNEIRSAAGVLL